MRRDWKRFLGFFGSLTAPWLIVAACATQPIAAAAPPVQFYTITPDDAPATSFHILGGLPTEVWQHESGTAPQCHNADGTLFTVREPWCA